MTLRTSVAAFATAIAVSAAFFVSSCNDNSTTPAILIPVAPSNLMVLSVNDSTIRFGFTASSSESDADFKDYFLSALADGSSSPQTFTIAKGINLVDVPGLASGKRYVLTLKARSKDSASASVSIDWATARRYNNLRAYDKSSVPGSGIDLLDGVPQKTSAANKWDLCFDSDSAAYGSPGVSGFVSGGLINGFTPKRTYIFSKDANNIFFVTADSLNGVFETKAINDTASARKLKVETTVDVSGSKSFVMYCLTGDNYFAKVIIKASGGKLIQSDANGTYVEIDASVQTAALLPYALKRNFIGWDGPGIRSDKKMHVTNQ